MAQQSRVVQQVPLDGILACDDSATPLIPVVDKGLAGAVLEQVLVHDVALATRHDGAYIGLENLPTGTRKAVLWRMHGVTLRLPIVVADVRGERDGRAVSPIHACHVIGHAGDALFLVADPLIRDAHALPRREHGR